MRLGRVPAGLFQCPRSELGGQTEDHLLSAEKQPATNGVFQRDQATVAHVPWWLLVLLDHGVAQRGMLECVPNQHPTATHEGTGNVPLLDSVGTGRQVCPGPQLLPPARRIAKSEEESKADSGSHEGYHPVGPACSDRCLW